MQLDLLTYRPPTATRTVGTPNLAKQVASAGSDVPCQARGCRSGARWSLMTDETEVVNVCRLHANAAERRGRLVIR